MAWINEVGYVEGKLTVSAMIAVGSDGFGDSSDTVMFVRFRGFGIALLDV